MTKAEAIAEYKRIYSSALTTEEFEKNRAYVETLKDMLDTDDLFDLATWHISRMFGLGEDVPLPSTEEGIIEEYRSYFEDNQNPKTPKVRERLVLLRERISTENLIKLDQWHYDESYKLLTTRFGKTHDEAVKTLSQFKKFTGEGSN